MSNTNLQDPWHYALAERRDYITPEDIQAAIDAGVEAPTLHAIVLTAISYKQCEDYSCCAFVATKFERSPEPSKEKL